MFEKNKLLRALLAAGLTTGLVACGGGSSGGGETPPDDPTPPSDEQLTGQFVDSPVSGLEYETTSGLSGITNDEGEFQYLAGETVSFKIGAFNIGSSAGAGVVSPFSLTANDETKAANIARFLQTLDDDGVPGNGITITENTRAEAAKQNPSDIASAALDTDSFKTIVTSLTAKNSVPQTTVVSKDDALEHLNGTLGQLNPLESCSDERAKAVTSDRLIDKTFAFIRSNELGVYRFNNNGTLNDYSYDTERGDTYRDGASDTWELLNGGSAIKFGRDEAPITVCSTDNYLLFEEVDSKATAKLYDVKPYTLPSSAQSYVIGTVDGKQNAILTVKSDGGLAYFPAETPISEASNGSIDAATGALELDFDEGGVIDSIYFLAGQGKQTGVYLDYNEENRLAQVGVATLVPNAQEASAASVSGKTFVYRDTDANETVILTYEADGTLKDFNNDCYDGDQQNACYFAGEWAWLPEDKILEEYDVNGNATPYKIADGGTSLYLAEQLFEGGEIFELAKTQAITPAAFRGAYTIDIPTENTRFNKLVINDGGSCTYSDTACSWTVDGSGKAVISFTAYPDTKGNIWQLAGSTSKFAFVMTHADENDIEPGFMTRD